MTEERYASDPRLLPGPSDDVFQILNLIQDRHVLKLAVAFSMTVEVKAQRGYALIVKVVGHVSEERTVAVARETVAEYHQRDPA